MAEFQEISTSDISQAEHLTAEQIAAYLDHDLTESQRESVEQHLEACAQCRAELHAAAQLVDSWTPAADRPADHSRRRRRMPVAIIGTFAAAAVALIVFTGPRLLTSARQSDVSRAPASSEGRSHIDVISPNPDSIVVAEPLVFTWHSSPASLYRVTVLTESGEPIYSAETRDTSLVLPDSVRLAPEKIYFWRADGTGNGIVSSTGAALLRIRR